MCHFNVFEKLCKIILYLLLMSFGLQVQIIFEQEIMIYGILDSYFMLANLRLSVLIARWTLLLSLTSKGCECLNGSDKTPFENVLKVDETYLESDCDEQVCRFECLVK